jgi:beta-lactam-binding protein with PASTA domain
MTKAPETSMRLARFTLAFAVAIALVFAVGACGGDGGSGKQVHVPSVEGKLFDDAVSQLKDAGFDPELKRKPDPTPRDIVLTQDPPAFKLAEEGSKVTIVVSSGP